MGFFSERNIDWMERHDKSWPSPEQRLLWRIEALEFRLVELYCNEEAWHDKYGFEDCRLSEEDIRYTLPEHLHNICVVERAIALAKEELLAKWGVKYPLLHACPENGTMIVA